MSTVTEEDLIEIAKRMSQELQEFIDTAKEAGTELTGTVALLKEWQDQYVTFSKPPDTKSILDEISQNRADPAYRDDFTETRDVVRANMALWALSQIGIDDISDEHKNAIESVSALIKALT